MTATATTTFLHPNVTGSPIMATDTSGDPAWFENYSAFGERLKNEPSANISPTANQNWFIGKPVDSATGLVYFGGRWYDPEIARFLSFDPAPVDEANPHSFNRYAYGNNNPYKYLDPDGRQVAAAFAIGGAAFVLGYVAAHPQTPGSTVMPGANPPAVDSSSGVMANPSQGSQSSNILSNPGSTIQSVLALVNPMLTPAGWASQIITSMMLGEKGTQVHSQTVWGGGKNAPRIDVENPAPGQRPGQIHYQHGKDKYLYDAESKSFPGAPKSVNELAKQPDVMRGIDKGMKILGEKTE